MRTGSSYGPVMYKDSDIKESSIREIRIQETVIVCTHRINSASVIKELHVIHICNSYLRGSLVYLILIKVSLNVVNDFRLCTIYQLIIKISILDS